MSKKPPKPRDTHAQIPANLPTAAYGTDIGTKWQTPALEAALNPPQAPAAPVTASLKYSNHSIKLQRNERLLFWLLPMRPNQHTLSMSI